MLGNCSCLFCFPLLFCLFGGGGRIRSVFRISDVTLCMLGNCSCLFCFPLLFCLFGGGGGVNPQGMPSKVANNLDQDQARHIVGPDLGPKC